MDIDLDQDASEYFPQKTYLQFAQVREDELQLTLKLIPSLLPY